MIQPIVETYFGVDFSGAKEAGRNIWIARLTAGPTRYRLEALDRLETLAGTADRSAALAHLVEAVGASRAALWGFDFPFGLPIELFPPNTPWSAQFDFLAEFADDARGCGLECVRRAKELTVPTPHRTVLHSRRQTDVEAQAPFDTFHYRIIYQTFFGMRDVIGRLRHQPRTAVLPFQYRKLPSAERVILECCPGCVLKAWGVPHQNYKQPTGGPLTARRRRTRHTILAALEGCVDVSDRFRRVVMRNPGGDALDAVIAAVGAARSYAWTDHAAVARHPRYRHEGYLYVSADRTGRND